MYFMTVYYAYIFLLFIYYFYWNILFGWIKNIFNSAPDIFCCAWEHLSVNNFAIILATILLGSKLNIFHIIPP